MPSKMAMVVFDKCQPEKYQQGTCLVVALAVFHTIRRWGKDKKYLNWMVDV